MAGHSNKVKSEIGLRGSVCTAECGCCFTFFVQLYDEDGSADIIQNGEKVFPERKMAEDQLTKTIREMFGVVQLTVTELFGPAQVLQKGQKTI